MKIKSNYEGLIWPGCADMTIEGLCLEIVEPSFTQEAGVMGKGKKMMKDFNDNHINIHDGNDNGSSDMKPEISSFPNDCLYFDKERKGSLTSLLDIDNVKVNFQGCERCKALNQLAVSSLESGDFSCCFDKRNLPKNGLKTVTCIAVERQSEDRVGCPKRSYEGNTASKENVERSDTLTEKNNADTNCTFSEGKEETPELGLNAAADCCIECNCQETNNQVQFICTGDTGQNESLSEKEEKENVPSPGENGCDPVEDQNEPPSDFSVLDINNPNLFSDLEDSDDDVFEFETNRLPQCAHLFRNRSKHTGHTQSESAIFTNLSETTDKPRQTVSDSAILLSALSKKTDKHACQTTRKKSVHFAIFPYVIEIPRVSDLEKEFFDTERERYGNTFFFIFTKYIAYFNSYIDVLLM